MASTDPAPIRIPLSAHQTAEFAALRHEIASLTEELTARKNYAVRLILAGTTDPALLATWSVALTDTEIVCSPPAATPDGPAAADVAPSQADAMLT